MGQTVSNVIFDVGNVLIDFCWEKTCEMLHFSRDIIDAFEKNMILTDVWDMLDEGTISLEHAILRFIEAMPQYEKEVRLFWEHADTFVEEYDYAFELIKELKEKGYKVYLLSNYPLDMYKLHWPTFRFFELVDGYIVSAVEKLRKPDIRIYKLLCERYGLEPSVCEIFQTVAGGMQGILFESDETVKQYFDL